jgi:hypothetical protein
MRKVFRCQSASKVGLTEGLITILGAPFSEGFIEGLGGRDCFRVSDAGVLDEQAHNVHLSTVGFGCFGHFKRGL